MKYFVTFSSMLFMPFLFAGGVNVVKSLWAGRKGPSILQPFYDFARLMSKGETVGKSTSFIFAAGPSVYMASVAASALFIPYGYNESICSFRGDFIVLAYIMSSGNFSMILSALDTGSSFEGMGASRDATLAIFTDASLFLILSSFIYLSGYQSLSRMMSHINFANSYTSVASILAVIAFFIMLIVEGKRVPVDDPNTHLELTMIHEVMVLDHSGPNLAYTVYASNLKMTVFNALIASIIFAEAGALFSFFGFIAVNILSALILGTIESVNARFKMPNVPQFALMMFGIALFISIAVIMGRSGGL